MNLVDEMASVLNLRLFSTNVYQRFVFNVVSAYREVCLRLFMAGRGHFMRSERITRLRLLNTCQTEP